MRPLREKQAEATGFYTTLPGQGQSLPHNLTITKNLVGLERGEEELLLADSSNLKPLYVKRGRDYVRAFLESIKELGTTERIAEAFPDDMDLLRLLFHHHIVLARDDAQNDGSPAVMPDPKDARENRNAMSLYLLLSQSCNLRCVYCLNGTQTYKTGSNLRMSEEVAFKSIERCLDSLSPEGTLEIVFFGGEPLLNWPLAKRIILHCEGDLKKIYPGKVIRYHLTSNLTILPPDLIDWAKKYNITFLCDIDGPAAVQDECRPFKGGRGSHAIITMNIKRLIDSGLKVSLRSTITKKNQDCMLEIAKHHKELGGAGSAFVPVNPVNSDEDILSENLMPSVDKVVDGLTEVYKSNIWDKTNLFPFNVYISHVYEGARNIVGCGAPYGNTPVVDVNGDVYPCIYLVGIKRFYTGNVLSDDYPDNSILDWMMNYLNVDNMAECKFCEWRYICGGGCPVGKLTIYENPRASRDVASYCKSICCDYTKRILELLLWDMAEEAAVSATTDVPNEEEKSIIHPSMSC